MRLFLIKFITIWVLVSCFNTLHAQNLNYIEGTIVDSTRNPIPYVEITFRDKGTTSWKDGTFHIELWEVKTTDTLKISCLGYETKKISIKNYLTREQNKIVLKEKSYEIEKVTVSAKKYEKKKLKKFGIFKKPAKGWYMDKTNKQIAVYIPNKNNQYGIIENIQYFIRNQGKPDQKFRVHLYALDSINNCPGKELLPKAIYASGTLGEEWVAVDIKEYNIEFPKSGFFISLERLPSDPLESYITIKNKKFKVKTAKVVLGLSYENHRERLTWYFRQDKWIREHPERRNEIAGNAMMAAEILIYK